MNQTTLHIIHPSAIPNTGIDNNRHGIILTTAHLEELISPSERWHIWQTAFSLAQSWYWVNGEDVTLFNGISLGRIVEIEIWYFLREVLEYVLIFQKITKLYNPKKIILTTFQNGFFARIISLFDNIKVEQGYSSPVQVAKHWLSDDHRLSLLKASELDRHMRFLALQTQGSNRHSLTNRPFQVLAVLELPGAHYSDTLEPILEHVHNGAIMLMDHRHLKRRIVQQYHTILFSEYVTRLIPKLFKHTRYWQQLFKAIKKDLMENFTINGVCYWNVIDFRLKRLFSLKLPLVVIELLAAELALKVHDIQCLLLHSDAHHGSRLFTLVGQQLGIPSVVAQHGLTLGEWGYIPLYANYFAAWGNQSRQWMIDHGVSPERIVITGSPRIDRILSLTPLSRTDLHLPEQRKLILWPIDPGPISHLRSIFEQIMQAISDNPPLTLLIRPHPSMREISWLKEAAAKYSQCLFSPAHYDLFSIIYHCEAILVQETTVGVEAMAFEKPIIVFPYNEHSVISTIYPPEAIFACVSVADLQNGFRLINNNNSVLVTKKERARRFITDVFYRLDGQSARRVAAIINKMVLHPSTKS